MKIARLYDLLAPLYARLVPPLYDLVTARASQRLSAGAPGSILEVGVGPGHVLSALGKRNRDARTVGIDISAAMLRQARRILAQSAVKADLIRADAVKLPFRDGAFEGVVGAFLLDLFQREAIPAALREMARVVAPGGRIVVASLQFSNPWIKAAWMTVYSIWPNAVGRIRPVDFQAYVDETDFRVLRDEEIPQAAGTRLITLVKVVG